VIFKRCPSCQQRSAKRECPALGQTICAVCCATKRQVEIACPPDCAYLSSARAHPAAVVQRRRERDLRFLMPLIQDLSERQYRLLLAMQAAVLKHAGSALPAPNDGDVRDAAGTLASTLETARKGIIYEHPTASVPAQRIASELRAFLAEIERDGPVPGLDRDAATVLRRIEQGARDAAGAFAEDGDRAYLALLGRVMAQAMAGEGERGDDARRGPRPGGLIIP
jgi:hypothetical protein